MLKKVLFLGFSGALLIGAFATPSTAADGWYVSGSGGVAILKESSSTGTITGGSATGDVSFDNGFGIAGSIGHAFGPIRVEGELSYRKNDLDDVTSVAGLAGTIIFTTTGAVSLGGDVSSFGFMANAFYDFDAGDNWAPFLMAGLGGAKINIDADTVNSVAVIYDESDTVFAYQIGAGVAYNFTPQTAVNVQYRIMGTADPEFSDGTVVIDGEYMSHNFLVGLTQQF